MKKRSSPHHHDLGAMPVPRSPGEAEVCVDPFPGSGLDLARRDGEASSSTLSPMQAAIRRRQVVEVPPTPGYTTKDDFGTDGDDTLHSAIPFFRIPDYFAGSAGFSQQPPATVDVVFVDFIEPDVRKIVGTGFVSDCYAGCNFTSQDYLIPYAKAKWQAGLPNCPI
jgi:hypothetical protein